MVLSVGFKALGNDERARLDQLAVEDKERYDREMKEYCLKQSLPQQERVKTPEDDNFVPPLQSMPQLPSKTTALLQTKLPPPTPQPLGNSEVVTPATFETGVPSSNKENSISSTETLANLDRVREMEAASQRKRRIMVTDHYNQMKNKTAAIALERVDSLIGCHAKDETELVEGLKKKFGDKTKGIEEEIALLKTMRANATERGFKTTDIDERLSQETTKLNSINAEFESEKNEELDRLKNVYVGLYEATKKEFISLGTKQLPLSVIDNCSEKWKSYMESNNMVAV